ADEYAHPSWLVERWVVQFGIEVAAQICEHDQQAPATSLRVHPQHNHSQLNAELRKEGVEVVPGALLAGARRVTNGDISQTAAFREGRIAIQDEASQLV